MTVLRSFVSTVATVSLVLLLPSNYNVVWSQDVGSECLEDDQCNPGLSCWCQEEFKRFYDPVTGLEVAFDGEGGDVVGGGVSTMGTVDIDPDDFGTRLLSGKNKDARTTSNTVRRRTRGGRRKLQDGGVSILGHKKKCGKAGGTERNGICTNDCTEDADITCSQCGMFNPGKPGDLCCDIADTDAAAATGTASTATYNQRSCNCDEDEYLSCERGCNFDLKTVGEPCCMNRGGIDERRSSSSVQKAAEEKPYLTCPSCMDVIGRSCLDGCTPIEKTIQTVPVQCCTQDDKERIRAQAGWTTERNKKRGDNDDDNYKLTLPSTCNTPTNTAEKLQDCESFCNKADKKVLECTSREVSELCLERRNRFRFLEDTTGTVFQPLPDEKTVAEQFIENHESDPSATFTEAHDVIQPIEVLQKAVSFVEGTYQAKEVVVNGSRAHDDHQGKYSLSVKAETIIELLGKDNVQRLLDMLYFHTGGNMDTSPVTKVFFQRFEHDGDKVSPYHTDGEAISLVLLLNDDYEGGDVLHLTPSGAQRTKSYPGTATAHGPDIVHGITPNLKAPKYMLILKHHYNRPDKLGVVRISKAMVEKMAWS